MDRQATFLLALGLLIAAAAVVSVCGWILFVRDRRSGRPGGDDKPRVQTEPGTDAEPAAELAPSDPTTGS
jgi:hypothetical protein